MNFFNITPFFLCLIFAVAAGIKRNQNCFFVVIAFCDAYLQVTPTLSIKYSVRPSKPDSVPIIR